MDTNLTENYDIYMAGQGTTQEISFYGYTEGTPYNSCSLPKGYDRTKPCNVYEVIEPVEVKAGKVFSWFGEPGGGI